MQNKKNLIISAIILVIAISAIIFALSTKLVYITACTNGSYPTIDFEKSFGIFEYIKEDIFFNYDLYYIFESAGGPMWLVVGSIISNILPLICTAILCVAIIVEIIYAFTKRVLAHNNSLIKPLTILTGILYLIICIFCFVGYTINNSMSSGHMEFYTDTGFYINAVAGLALVVLPCFLGDRKKEPNTNKVKNAILYGLTSILSVAVAILVLSNQYNADLLPETTIFGLTTYVVTNSLELGLPVAGDIPFGISQYTIFAIFLCLTFVGVYSIIALVRTLANKKTNWLSIRIKRWSIALALAIFTLYFLVICSICVFHTNIVLDMGSEYLYALGANSIICFALPFVMLLIARLIPAEKKNKSKI